MVKILLLVLMRGLRTPISHFEPGNPDYIAVERPASTDREPPEYVENVGGTDCSGTGIGRTFRRRCQRTSQTR